jgi:hypothetical protein
MAGNTCPDVRMSGCPLAGAGHAPINRTGWLAVGGHEGLNGFSSKLNLNQNLNIFKIKWVLENQTLRNQNP